jgi:PPOX class probable F420-dependent enzyme
MDPQVRSFFEGRNFCHVSTLRADGSVHAVLVWTHTEGDLVTLNSAEGRDWPANLRRDPRVTLLVADANDQRNFARVEGRLVGVDHADAEAHVDLLGHKYEGTPGYPYRVAGEVRIKLLIEPEKSWVFIGGKAGAQPSSA